MKNFQKDIKSKLKNLLVVSLTIGAYLFGRQISANSSEQNLQNQQHDFAKKETAYKEKIKNLQEKPQDIKFYDINALGVRNSLVDSLNYKNYKPLIIKDYAENKMQVPDESELKQMMLHLKKNSKTFADMEKQKKILVRKINTCPKDSAELFFKTCKQYRRVLLKEMAMLYDKNIGRVLYLKLPEKHVRAAFHQEAKKLNDAKDVYHNVKVAGEMRFMENALALRNLALVNNQAIEVFAQIDKNKAVVHAQEFEQRQQKKRAQIVDSLVADFKQKEKSKIQKLISVESMRNLNRSWMRQ